MEIHAKSDKLSSGYTNNDEKLPSDSQKFSDIGPPPLMA